MCRFGGFFAFVLVDFLCFGFGLKLLHPISVRWALITSLWGNLIILNAVSFMLFLLLEMCLFSFSVLCE